MDCYYKYDVLLIRYYDKTHRVVCFDIMDTGELLCYFVMDHEPKYEAPLVPIHYSNGEKTNFMIDCERQFIIPIRYVHERLFVCLRTDLELAMKYYKSQPTLACLEKKYKELRHQLQLMGPNKTLQREVNQLNETINRRKKHVFETPTMRRNLDRKDQYRNFRLLPDQGGIITIYHGGKCSGK